MNAGQGISGKGVYNILRMPIGKFADLNLATMKLCCLIVVYTLCIPVLYAQKYSFVKSEIPVTSHFRALSVVNDSIAWVSGNKGQVGHTRDGGSSWTFTSVPGFEDADFRSLYAFDEHHALVANAGSPANILHTADGGLTWRTAYTNTHKDAFFDGIDFWNRQQGIIYGDPIEGHMLLLRTADGGLTWTKVAQSPALAEGEASFAASGTCIRCLGKSKVTICTGGKVSRIWYSGNKGARWTAFSAPIVQGENSTGIFSLAWHNNTLTIVGGDFQKPEMANDHHFYSSDGGKHWSKPTVAVRGYRECIEPVTKKTIIATGPGGTDISENNGRTWAALSDIKGLHVIRKARHGSLIIAAGSNGSVFIVSPE